MSYVEGLTGKPWSVEAMERARPEHLTYIRGCFEFLETTLLADGREWVLKTDRPSLADIEGECIFLRLSQRSLGQAPSMRHYLNTKQTAITEMATRCGV